MVLVGKIVLGNTEEMRGSTCVSIFQGTKPILKIQNKIKTFLFKWFKKLHQQFKIINFPNQVSNFKIQYT